MNDKFETLLLILGLIYRVERQENEAAIVSFFNAANSIVIRQENNVITASTANGQDSAVMDIDEPVGSLAIRAEMVLLKATPSCSHGPIAYSTYLYYTLLGVLWGLKASPEIQQKDPSPDNAAYTLLIGTKNDRKYTYEYMAKMSGNLCVIKHADHGKQEFSFSCKQYLEDPEHVISDFVNFFKDIDYIESVGKG